MKLIEKEEVILLFLGETKLICWSTDPTDPNLSKNKNFGQPLIIFCFLKQKSKK